MASGTEVGKIFYTLDLDDSKLKGGMTDAEKNVGSFGDTLIGLGKKTALAFAAAGVAATGFAVKSAADFEQTRISLENMLGSADAARSVLATVSKFAADTPFEFPELAGSVKQLIAFGFNANDAIGTMKQLGDVSAAVGAPIGDLSYLMGTLKTQGRAMTIDIRQFAQRGIPIYEYLGKVLNKNTQEISGMIEAGKIGFPEVQKAFAAMTAEGGQFHGTMAKQSKSLAGLWSTLKDNIGQAGRELVGINQQGDVRNGSIFDMLRKGATGLIGVLPELVADLQRWSTNLNKWLGEMKPKFDAIVTVVKQALAPSFEALWNVISTKVFPILLRLWNEVIQPLLPGLGVLLVGAIWLVVNGLTAMLQIVTPLVTFMLDNKGVVLAFAAAWVVLKGAMMFNDVFNALTIGFNVLKLITIPSVMAEMTALKILVSTPMIMPAIAIGAALVALGAVYDSAQKTKAAVDGALNAQVKAADQGAAIVDIRKKFEAGKITATQRDNAINALLKGVDSLKYAKGTDYAKGGLSLVGERGPELLNIPRGSQVTTADKTKQMLSGGSRNTTYIYGDIKLANDVDVDSFFARLGRKQELAAQGMTA